MIIIFIGCLTCMKFCSLMITLTSFNFTSSCAYLTPLQNKSFPSQIVPCFHLFQLLSTVFNDIDQGNIKEWLHKALHSVSSLSDYAFTHTETPLHRLTLTNPHELILGCQLFFRNTCMCENSSKHARWVQPLYPLVICCSYTWPELDIQTSYVCL